MKKIEAIIRPEKLNDIKSALATDGFIGLTTYEVKGRGRQKGIVLSYRTSEHRVDMLRGIGLMIGVELITHK